MNKFDVYVASSWRNGYQPEVVRALRSACLEAYDFRTPAPGVRGFAWSEIDPDWQQWSVPQFANSIEHPLAVNGYGHDMRALMGADVTVLVLPCGRSAHLEAGLAAGMDKVLIVYSPEPCEPELMYRMAVLVTDDLNEVVTVAKAAVEWADARREVDCPPMSPHLSCGWDMVRKRLLSKLPAREAQP